MKNLVLLCASAALVLSITVAAFADTDCGDEAMIWAAGGPWCGDGGDFGAARLAAEAEMKESFEDMATQLGDRCETDSCPMMGGGVVSCTETIHWTGETDVVSTTVNYDAEPPIWTVCVEYSGLFFVTCDECPPYEPGPVPMPPR